MSDKILKRSIFVGKDRNGLLRISDWSMVVVSGFGTMFECRPENRHKSGADAFDWTNEANRIDDMLPFDPQNNTYGEGTIGGPLAPLEGY